MEIADQTETARVKNILMGVGVGLLAKACIEADIKFKKNVAKGDLEKAKEWHDKKIIICKMANEAAKACLGA